MSRFANLLSKLGLTFTPPPDAAAKLDVSDHDLKLLLIQAVATAARNLKGEKGVHLILDDSTTDTTMPFECLQFITDCQITSIYLPHWTGGDITTVLFPAGTIIYGGPFREVALRTGDIALGYKS